MRRRECLWLIGLGWLYGPALLTRPAAAHRAESGRTSAAGRQSVQSPVPTFTLTDQEGQPFAFQSWRGRVVLVTFGFTTCSDVCPLLAANLALIQQQLEEAGRTHTRLLFITTDPEHDSPGVLRAYGTQLGADFSTWKFLTGSVQELGRVWRGFGVFVKKLGPGEVDHTTLTTLVDTEGIRRVNYYGTRWRPETVMDDLVAWARRMPTKP
ncbi:MAG: SCO family protein [Candidatus Entotheonellia bacterium]